MSKRSKRSQKLRIATEKSQPPWNRSTKDARRDNEVVALKNRIHALEDALGMVSRGGDGEPLVLFVSYQVNRYLDTLTSTGFYGKSVADTARQLLYEKAREALAFSLRQPVGES